MPTILIPSGILKRPPKAYSPELLEQTINDFPLLEPTFTGFIAIRSCDILYLLFFFNGVPYSAGKSIGEKPFLLSVKDFLKEVSLLVDSQLSIHATDPVLLKCLLVFINDDVTAKAPTKLINIESILYQIQEEKTDALIILEKNSMFNFFFFKDGIKGKAYYSDMDFTQDTSLPIDEQMLVYAFQGGNVDIDALIYRNLIIPETVHTEILLPNEVSALLKTNGSKTGIFKASEMSDKANIVQKDLLLEVVAGSLKGEIFSAAIPCVIGRKDTDIVILDPMVSKTHAAVQIVNGIIVLIDLNSTNGTHLNGVIVQKHEIAAGDLITVGETKLKVMQLKKS